MAKYHNNDCSRASLLYFKDGVTQAQAEEAVRSIAHLLKINEDWKTGEAMDPGEYVQGYDPDMGSPVWYIP